MKFYQLGEIKAGKAFYNKEKMQNLISNLFDGTYLISMERIAPKSNVKDYRACYFAKIDILAAEVGETRYSMHEIVKENVVSEMMDELPSLFVPVEATTKALTLEGWTVLLKRLDIWAFTEYNVVLP